MINYKPDIESALSNIVIDVLELCILTGFRFIVLKNSRLCAGKYGYYFQRVYSTCID